MQVKRNELIGLLRAHEDEESAQRAEHSLPVNIDLDRDRVLLLQIGVDPRVLEALLSADDRSAQQTGSLSLPPTGGRRVVAAGQQATTPPRAREDAEREVVRLPASWCPRCRLRFDSIDLMLDHLNGEHLRSTSVDGLRAVSARPRLSLSTSEIDTALEEMARALQAPVLHELAAATSGHTRLRRQSLLRVIGSLLLVTGTVTVIAGEAIGGAILVVLTVCVAAVIRLVPRRPVASRTRPEPGEEEG
jgi:hypothetical protein